MSCVALGWQNQMALLSAADSVRRIFSDLGKSRREYEESLKNMSEEEVKEETSKRLDEYKSLCLGGVTSMLWKDTYSLTKKLHGVYPVAAAMSSILFLLALLFILLGLAASTFSRSAPHAMALAGNGGLWSVLFIIVAAHFEMMDILPMVLLAISCVIFSSIFTIYWYFCSRDLKILLMTAKYLFKILYMVWCRFKAICRYLGVKVVNFFHRKASGQQNHAGDIALWEMRLAENGNADEIVWRQHNRHFL
ncbi:uncharacterized protein C2845_PM18G02580 [Panicum miliaceum]|uniref:Uncharacterized protein n=1 Tax=Panicum miliaceum TaxID=4540 RepID=A0A3L6PKW4_PANMI|nr:uncharacterized protein C2845_PM18G02580 [Panicum miliaceum]